MSSIIKGLISELNPDLQKRLAARKAGQITSFDKPIAAPKAPASPVAPAPKSDVNPELQKRLAARKAGKPVYSGGLEEGADRQAELEMALQKAKQITKQIKYDDTVTDIIVQIQMLAEKFNIDKDSLESAIDDVYNAKNQLESAVYGLDEVFEDALQQSRWDDDELDEEKQGLWANIHAKRERIKHGSGERMRKPGSKGAPSAQDFKDSQKTSKNEGVAEGSLNEGQYEMMMRNGQVKKFIAKDDADAKRIAAGHGAKSVIRLKGGVPAGKVSEQGVAEGVDPATYPARAKEAHEKYLKYENLVDQELRKFGQRLPKAWDAARMMTKLSSDPKYALALKYYKLSEKFASLAIWYEDLAKKRQGVAEGLDAEAYKEKLLATLPQMMRFYEKNVKGWKPSEEQMLAAVETGYTVMKHTGDVKQAGKAVMDELNTLHRMSQGQQGVAEEKQRLDPKCWTGYKKQGTKMKGGVRVNNCVPKESVEEDTAYAGGMGQGGNAGQSYRKYKVKPSGIGQGISETEAVNRNDGDGWRWYDVKPAGK